MIQKSQSMATPLPSVTSTHLASGAQSTSLEALTYRPVTSAEGDLKKWDHPCALLTLKVQVLIVQWVFIKCHWANEWLYPKGQKYSKASQGNFILLQIFKEYEHTWVCHILKIYSYF
jgi:hypothetical protein